MAYDYEKSKKLYESLSPEKQQEFAKDTSGNVQRFLSEYNAAQNKSQTNQTSNTSNSSSTPVNNNITNKTEYQGTGGSTKDVSSNPYVNQGNGNYSYNPKSGYYEINKSGGTNTGTSTPVDSTTSTNSNYAKIRDAWDKLSYKEQQAKLKENPSLKAGVEKVGGTFKTADEIPTEDTGDTGFTGKTADGNWDYQDNSPERMAQMAYNVDQIYQSNPGIFANEDSFRNFFIDGKGRTPEQEKFLMDYYKNRKTYNEYDGYTSEAVGSMYAYGKVPESYLNYVKTSNPQRYAEIMDAKDKEQDKIKNNSSYDSILEQNGFESTNNLDWQKREGLLVDKNNDLIDDRLYHEPTEEERQKVDRINEIDSRLLEINNALKWAEEDLTKAYPGATKATIMALVNDRSQNLLREKDDLMVERTQLAGTVDYLQNERQQQDDAGYKTIAQLQKNLGMYYDYTPEGMSELAQAQYAATNVTLDQADNGTDTQKQMALDSVLSPIYEQYGDIIQRPKAQVINDVMAYAKNNGVSLSEALDQNFMKYLKEKPAYQQRVNSADTSNISWTKIGEDADGNAIYGFVDTLNKTVDPYGNFGGKAGGSGYEYTVDGINSDRKERVSYMSDLASNYTTIGDMANAIANGMDGLGGGELDCGKYVNDYINAVTGVKGDYGNSIESKTALAKNKNWEDIQVGDAIVFDYNINTPQWVLNSDQKDDLLKYGHVGIVTGVNDDGSITMSHTNGGVVTETTVKPGSPFYNSFAGSQHIQPSKSKQGGYNEQWSNEYVAFLNAADNPETQKKIAAGLGLSVDEMREQSNRYSRSQTADSYYDVLDKINRLLDEIDAGNLPTFYERGNALSDGWFGGITSGVNQKVADWYDANDRIVSVLGLDSLINLKGRGATFGALSDSERQAINTYATSLGKNKSDKKYKQELIRLRDKLIESSHGYLGDLSKYGQNASYDWAAGIN